MNKKFIPILIALTIIGYLFYPSSNNAGWESPTPYAKSSWPTIHRDSRNSDYLPLVTTDLLEQKWHALKGEYSAVLTPPVIGSEGNIYFTTGKKQEYGNLHAFNCEGKELWRSYLLDNGAFGSSPLIDKEGRLYIADSDEFFCFHSHGTLKWQRSGIDGPFASTALLPDGLIVGINGNGRVYVFDPKDGRLAADPYDLPGIPPPDIYRIDPPPGLWMGMVSDGDPMSVGDIFNGLLGYQFKITNTPAIDPYNGRIYIVGTILSLSPVPHIQGIFYGIDFIPGGDHHLGELVSAFRTEMGAGSGSSPAISPDCSRIYASDGDGILYSFNREGSIAWSLEVGSSPSSPTIGKDGTIYGVSGSYLYAVTDTGNLGIILWQIDFTDMMIQKLPESIPTWIGMLYPPGSTPNVNPTVRCNSVVSASKNHVYLALALGYEVTLPGRDKPIFFPMGSYLAILSQSCSKDKTDVVISSIIEVPDTSEGIISLDRDGTVYYTHASVTSSIAYFIYQLLGENLQNMGYDIQMMGPACLKPTGGVTVLGPNFIWS